MVVVHNSQFLTVPLSDETILVCFYEFIHLFLRLGAFLPILQSKLIFLMFAGLNFVYYKLLRRKLLKLMFSETACGNKRCFAFYDA